MPTLLALALLAQPPAPPPRSPEPRLLTRVSNAYPAWSPDGQRIAFMCDADGDFDLYAINADTSGLVQLTDAPGRDGTPVWSPDAKRIAFQSFRDGNSEVYAIAADGSGAINLTNDRAHDEHPFYASDGARILFCSDRSTPLGATQRTFDIFEMRADGTAVRQITRTPQTETYASWSPDGARIVCRKVMTDGNWEVVSYDKDGGDERILAPSPSIDGWPVWSPDGSRVVFTSDREVPGGAGSCLWVVNAAGGEPVRLTTPRPGVEHRQAAWSPDGTTIAFARYEWFHVREPARFENAEILTIPAPPAGLLPVKG